MNLISKKKELSLEKINCVLSDSTLSVGEVAGIDEVMSLEITIKTRFKPQQPERQNKTDRLKVQRTTKVAAGCDGKEGKYFVFPSKVICQLTSWATT